MDAGHTPDIRVRSLSDSFAFGSRPTHPRAFLPPNRVLDEIEAFAKDLDVPGPTFPFDSVWMFLTLCLKIANQDLRLYRMQLEDRVITWSTKSWRVAGEAGNTKDQHGRAKSRVPDHTVNDVLLALESICGLAKRSNVIYRRLLPPGRQCHHRALSNCRHPRLAPLRSPSSVPASGRKFSIFRIR